MRRCRLRRVWEVNGFHLESCREVRIASTGGAYGWLSNFEAHGLRLVCNSLPRSFLFTMEFSDGIGMRGISRVQGRKYVCCMEYGRRFGHSFRTSSTNVARLFVYLSLKSEKNMMKEKLVFVTNDDGYNSRGIQALLEVARKFGRVVAIAPETPQSGMSQAITINNPLFLREVSKGDGVEVYAFSGTPVDCVKIAFDYFLKGRKVDLALSGINHGSNSAANILYSGTMGGAIESSFYGCPAIGLSLDDHSLEADFEAAKIYSERIVRAVVEANPPTPFCLNVNIPKGRPEAVKGIRVCRQNKGYWREEFFRRHDPRGREYFWLTGAFVNSEPESTDTDEWALANGYVSVVPVQTDMTDYAQMAPLERILG